MVCAGNSEFLSVGTGADINVFSTKELNLVAQSSADSLIQAIHAFDGKEPIVVTVDETAMKIFIGTLSDHPLLVLNHNLNIEKKCCFISSKSIQGTCHIVIVTSGHGLRVVVPMWDLLLSADKENFLGFAKKSMGAMSKHLFEAPKEISGFRIGDCGDLTFFPNQAGVSVSVVAARQPMEIHQLFDFDFSPRAIFEYAAGGFLAVIDESNGLHLIDNFTLAIIDTIQLQIVGKIDSFYIINDTPFNPGFDQIALTIERDSQRFVEIFSLHSGKVLFSAPVRGGTKLLDGGEDSKRLLLLVEPFDSEYPSNPDGAVRISELVEVNPQSCLERMVAHGQFDSAIEFARKHQLDEQQIYIAQMAYLGDKLSISAAKEDVEQFLNVGKNIKDKDKVTELCLVGACRVEHPYSVSQILTFCSGFQLTDQYTIESLEKMWFSLTTFRLILGDQCETKMAYKIWQKFMQDGELFSVLSQFLTMGLMAEARMIWMRHRMDILQGFQFSEEISKESTNAPNFLEEIFSQVRHGIKVRSDCWREALSFLEIEVINALPVEQRIEAIVLLWQLIEWLVLFLERNDTNNFPDNAIYVAGAVYRIANDIVNESITPLMLANSIYVSRNLGLVDGVEPNIMDVATKLVHQLESIKELRTNFNCYFSFDEFRTMSIEDVCYKILDQSLSNPAKIRDNVATYARPYMKKHNLPIDHTLFDYIKRQSCNMAASNSSSVWGQYCLIVIGAIENTQIRHRALMEVARLSPAPWNAELQKAVNAVLSDKQVNIKIQKELKQVCIQVEIALMLKKYCLTTDFERIKEYLSTAVTFEKILRFIFADSTHDIKTQAEDAGKLVNLFNELSGKIVFSSVRVPILLCDSLLNKLSNQFTSVIEYLSSAEATGGKQILDELILTLASHLETHINSSSKCQRQLRLQQCMALETLIVRFRRGDPFYENLYVDVKSLRVLQERYDICETLLFMRSAVERNHQLRKFFEKEQQNEQISIERVIDFASTLNFSDDQALCFMFEQNAVLRDADLAVLLFSKAVSIIRPFSTRLTELCLEAIDLVLLAMYYNSKSETEENLELIFQWGLTLQRKIPAFCLACEHSIDVYETLLRVNGYLELITTLFHQGSNEDPISEPTTKIESKEKLKEALDNRAGFHSLSQRLGYYNFASDPVLYEKIQTVQMISQVARSVMRLQEVKDDNLYTEMVEDWENLFSHLSLHNQHLLEFSARVYASYLPCYVNKPVDLGPSVQMIVQKVVVSHPGDLWTAIHALLTLPPTKMQNLVIRELKNFVRTQQSAQSHINYYRIAQFMSAVSGQGKDHKTNLTNSFRKALWQKNLRKMGISSSICAYAATRTDLVLSSFASSRVDPHIVVKFLQDFDLSVSLLLQYATLLFWEASNETDAKISDELLAKATFSIELAGVDPVNSFAVLLDIFYVLSPYNYRVLTAVLSKLEEMAQTDALKASIQPLKMVLNFLRNQPRTQEITKSEYIWYKERERCFEMALKEKNLTIQKLSGVVHARYLNGPDIEEMGPVIDELFAELDDEIFNKLPPQARKHLPVHLFLYEHSDDIRKCLKPTIELEIDIYSLTNWQDLASGLSHLLRSISRMELLKIAVCKSARQAVLEDQLCEGDSEKIWSCTVSNTNRADVITVLSTCVSSMKTTELRLSFLKLAQRVGQEWIDRKEHYKVREQEEAELRNKVSSIEMKIIQLETERILGASQVSRPDIMLDYDPRKLIEHIYTECINWNNIEDVAKKHQMVAELARINQMDLQKIEKDLVNEWLQEKKSETAIDMNDTMGMNDSLPIADVPKLDGKVTSRLPVFDMMTTRIARVIRRGDLASYASQLRQIIATSNFSLEACQQRLLALCVIAITFNPDELKQYFKVEDEDGLCTQVEWTSYMRLFALASYEMDLRKFIDTKRKQLIRSLIDNARTSQELTELIVCLILDENLDEKEYVEKVADRLLRYKSKDYLNLLLQHCGSHRKLHSVKNLSQFWIRVFEWNIQEIGDVRQSESGSRALQKWLYMLFSCPVAGIRSIDTVRNTLLNRRLHKANRLAPILANIGRNIDLSTLPPETSKCDLNFQWIDEQMSERKDEKDMDM